MDNSRIDTANVLASIAHDLRSPLNAVIGFSKLMLKGIDGPLSDMQSADLEAIHTNGNSMLQMVDGLIDLAKVQVGWYRPAPGPIYLRPLLDKLVSLAMSAAKESQVEILYRASDDALAVEADPTQIQRGLERVLRAAISLVGEGTVEVALDGGEQGTTIALAGTNPQGLPAEVEHTMAAFRSAGASAEERVDATALYLMVGEQMLSLGGCTLQVERASETEIRLTVRFPPQPL